MKNTAKYQSILDFNGYEARNFFLKSESYCNVDLPPYYNFQKVLDDISFFYDKKTKNKSNFSSYVDLRKVRGTEGVNYHIYSNKDGSLSWREFQIIHPALYVHLVHTITQNENWIKLVNRFKIFQKNEKIQCLSIPSQSLTKQSDRAEQVTNWWQNVEQRSIELALNFKYLYDTDIADCYGSIYTHSIAWAVETRDIAKQERSNPKLLGNEIDTILMSMQQNQTNGIPQGSELMNFIAEILLGYIDDKISAEIEKAEIENYEILRYRDDYRIFVNNPLHGSIILKILAEKLLEIGMRLNGEKTKHSNDVITTAIKADKLYWLSVNTHHKTPQQLLLSIRELSKKYPNSGTLRKELQKFYRNIDSEYKKTFNFLPDISIVTDITYHNPVTYPISFAIISKFLSMMDKIEDRNYVIDSIDNKFKNLPNTGFMQIWFKRMIKDTRLTVVFNEKLCKIIDEPVSIWNNDWVDDKELRKIIENTLAFDKNKYQSLDPIIHSTEFSLFNYQESNDTSLF